jgi:hypothetical protein
MGPKGAGLGLAAVALIALALPGVATGAYSYEFENPASEFPDSAQSGSALECPAGSVAISGGIALGGLSDEMAYMNTSRPGLINAPGEGWTVYVDNYTGGNASILASVEVVCDSNEAPYYTKTKAFSVPDGEEGEATAKCERADTPVGGGVVSDAFYPDETYISATAPADGKDRDRVPDDGWRAELNNDEGGATSASASVYAICDGTRSPSKYRFVSSQDTAADGFGGSETVACPQGTRLAGGGAQTFSAYRHGLYVAQTNINANGWTATVHNYDTPDGQARKLAVHAICRK